MSVRTGVDEYNQPTSDINSGYVGEFKYFGFESVPPHCLACDGSAVSRETYSELFAVFGETFGAGDGTTTFNLPDFRGRFLRCTGGNAAALGTAQGDAIRDIMGYLRAITTTYVSESGERGALIINTPQSSYSPWQVYLDDSDTGHPLTSYDAGLYTPIQNILFSAAHVVPTAAEVRPVNYAVNICVVYE